MHFFYYNMSINKYYDLAKTKLYPICRSITGRGLEETLKIIKKEFKSMKIYSVKSNFSFFKNVFIYIRFY